MATIKTVVRIVLLHVRVGHRQNLNTKALTEMLGLFLYTDKWLTSRWAVTKFGIGASAPLVYRILRG